jgi:hypothetical protein
MRSLFAATFALLVLFASPDEGYADEQSADETKEDADKQPEDETKEDADKQPEDETREDADKQPEDETSETVAPQDSGEAAIAVPAKSEPAPATPSLADRFSSSSVLVEHSFSVAHEADLSPEYTRSISRTLMFSPSFDISKNVSVAAQLGIAQELTVTDTTYPYEPMLDDLRVGVSGTLPGRSGKIGALGASTGIDFAVPTSKASRAASLIMAVEPWFKVGLTAPLLDGLELSYRVTPSPRIHRYTTASLRQERPCSPATGCSLGSTIDTGERNTGLQLHQDIGLSLSALNDKLSISGQMTLSYGVLYPKTPSDRFDEIILSDPDNAGGSPIRMSSAFLFDLSYQVHPGVGVSLGLWTPGGMRPDGGWYNPFGNRFSQVYIDVTLYPVALIQEGVRGLVSKNKASQP